MKKQALINFINVHRGRFGVSHIALNEKFWGQFALGYYYDEDTQKYKVYDVSERQDISIWGEYDVEEDAVERLYRKIKFAFHLYDNPIVLDENTIGAISLVDGHLELLLLDPNLWLPDTEHDHLLKLQEKINNYIHYLESQQYVAQYGDYFDKKVINITLKYSPSDKGLAFMVQTQKTLQATAMSLKLVFPD